jgi:radical SAM protein with 4Fe4S-binding SPASM domain
MRKDLPELIGYAVKNGMRTNLITNGIKCSDKELVKKLSDSGLHSAQVSLESHDELTHNIITGNMESYKKTVSGIHNLKDAGIHTHTNTTICRGNRELLIPLVKFVKDEFNASYLSMNMIIATGIARDNDNVNIGYSSISGILKPVLDYCDTTGIKLVWYSPTPYCMFNPVDHNLGSKSCACVSGLLSINPAGEVIPCSSYSRGLGSLLKDSFHHIWNSDEALYFREKRYIPPVCRKCSMKILCKGACPLYWENAGSFREIERVNRRRPLIGNFFWSLENRLRVKTKGVPGVDSPSKE